MQEKEFDRVYKAKSEKKSCRKLAALGVCWTLLVLLFIAVIFAVLHGKNYSTDFENRFHLHVIDYIHNTSIKIQGLEIDNADANLYTALDTFQTLSQGAFSFSTTEGKTRMIKVNGISEKNNNVVGHRWVLAKKTNDTCIPVGLHTYIPQNADDIILAYITDEMAHFVFSCFVRGDEQFVKISVQNYVANIDEERYGAIIRQNETLIELMERLRSENNDFRFEIIEYAGLGAMIISVNGLEQNASMSTYWAIGKWLDDRMCLLPVGASSYYPQPGEHISFAYMTLEMFNDFKSCDGGPIHDTFNIEVSVKNMIEDVEFADTSYTVEVKMNTSLINIMNELQDLNTNFRFTTVEYAGLGAMITSINELKQNSTLKTYWALGKMIQGKMCLLSSGASSYHILGEEHIVFAYITYDMFSTFNSCDKDISHELPLKFSVQNLVANIEFKNSSYTVERTNASLINLMAKLQSDDSSFRYATVEYEGLGEMITSVNGLEQNSTLNTYWALGKIVEKKLCLLSVGASSYYLKSGDEQIVLAYITYDIFKMFDLCDKSQNGSSEIVIAVLSVVDAISFENSYVIEYQSDETVMGLLKQLNDTNYDFSFTAQAISEGLRTEVTSVNGIWQSSDCFWALGKTVNGEKCLLTADIDGYHPLPGEKLLLMFSDSVTSASLPYC